MWFLGICCQLFLWAWSGHANQRDDMQFDRHARKTQPISCTWDAHGFKQHGRLRHTPSLSHSQCSGTWRRSCVRCTAYWLAPCHSEIPRCLLHWSLPGRRLGGLCSMVSSRSMSPSMPSNWLSIILMCACIPPVISESSFCGDVCLICNLLRVKTYWGALTSWRSLHPHVVFDPTNPLLSALRRVLSFNFVWRIWGGLLGHRVPGT